jgi:hypothetical protein
MIQVQFDAAKNCLKISFSGHVDEDDAKRSIPQVRAVLANPQPGFSMLTDLTGLDKMDLACEPYIDQIMDACNEKGVALIIRVIPDPHKDIGFNVMSLFHYRRGVRIITHQSLEEAEQTHLH